MSLSVKRWIPLGVVLALVALVLPFAQMAQANHGTRTLDVEPETGTRAFSTDPEAPTQPWVLTATLSSAPTFATGAVNIDFELESGPNNTDGASLGTPDLTCSIPAGATSCQVSYSGDSGGAVEATDLWRVWVDHDGKNGAQGGVTEADTAEGRNETTAPGSALPNAGCPATAPDSGNPPEPAGKDCTDVVEVEWTDPDGPPRADSLDCDDSTGPDTEHETNPHDAGGASNETYKCTVYDQYGNPLFDSNPDSSGNQATNIKGEVETETNDPDSPPNEGATYDSPDYNCNTPTNNNTASCNITVSQGELDTGTMVICFWVGDATAGQNLCSVESTGPNGEDTADNLADQVELTHEERALSSLEVETEKETLVVGEERTLTATAYDQFGDSYQGDTVVKFEFFKGSPNDPNSDGNSPNTPDGTCSMTNDSSCEFKYTGEDAGRDLICAWIGEDAPTLKRSSRNAGGTCSEEGRIDEDDDETQADAPQNGDRIDVVETTYTNATPATKLNCSPETGESLRGEKQQFSCKATAEGEGVPNTQIDVEIAGANDPDKARSFKTPDKRCTTNNQGVCTFGHTGKKTGTSSYTAWVDADYEDSTVEADKTEGRDEKEKPGATEEPDTTDKFTNNWVK